MARYVVVSGDYGATCPEDDGLPSLVLEIEAVYNQERCAVEAAAHMITDAVCDVAFVWRSGDARRDHIVYVSGMLLSLSLAELIPDWDRRVSFMDQLGSVAWFEPDAGTVAWTIVRPEPKGDSHE
jgi:hypothetical protein